MREPEVQPRSIFGRLFSCLRTLGTLCPIISVYIYTHSYIGVLGGNGQENENCPSSDMSF